jgi:hypothetical protein
MAEKIINGRTFRYMRRPALQSFGLGLRLVKALGPSLEKLGPVIADAEGEAKDIGAAMLPHIMAAASTIDPKTFEALSRELLDDVYVDGDKIKGNADAYIADVQELLQVLWFVVETEFASFFGDSLAAGPARARGQTPAL